MKKIELARTAGFCFGVERAVESVYTIIERENAKPEKERKQIYTYGAIVHNDTVVSKLADLGVKVIVSEEELDSLEDGIVIIRAHGIPRRVYELLERKKIEYIDMSCPFVQKIQRLVKKHTEKGEKAYVIGNPSHPEIVGIVGHALGETQSIADIEEAEKLPDADGKPCIFVAQTTFNVEKFKVIVDILKKKGYYGTVYNTICNATQERQAEAKELATKSDAMIVIGGSSSSNTKKLYEICRENCQNTQLVQTAADLESYSGEAIQSVGVTAGASTPKEIIEEVLTYVRNEF